MNDTTESLRQDLEQLKSNFIIAVSVLSGCIIVLLCLIIGLYCWIFLIHKKTTKDPFENFKLARPKLIHKSSKDPSMNNKSYDNPTFPENNSDDVNNRNVGDGFLNPISRRTKANISNDNFSFESPEYMARDSRFY